MVLGPVKVTRAGLRWLSLTAAQRRRNSRFAQAVALTRTAQLAREEARKLASRTFVLRSKAFTLRGIQIQRAEASDDSPTATLFGGPGYLTPHATDVPKTPGQGSEEFGIPITGQPARPTFPTKVPSRLRLSRLPRLPRASDLEGLPLLPGPEPIGGRGKRKRRRRRSRAGKPFILELADKALVARRRKPSEVREGQALEFLYVLEDDPLDLPDVYPFQDTAVRVSRKRYSTELAKAYVRALQTSRRR